MYIQDELKIGLQNGELTLAKPCAILRQLYIRGKHQRRISFSRDVVKHVRGDRIAELDMRRGAVRWGVAEKAR